MIVPGAGTIGAYLMAFTIRSGFPLLEFLQMFPSVELVGKKEQFPGIPWNTTVFSIVGLVIVVVLCVHYLELRNMIAIPFAVGEATNGLVAYIFPNWIHFQVASRATQPFDNDHGNTFECCILKLGMAALCGLPLLAWFFIPESPRWLIEREKATRYTSIPTAESSMKKPIFRTKALLKQIAKDNNKKLPLPR